ncbi:alpha/beta hydrolase [Labrys neptuniae]|uniref:alpha/beta fold hydrolase n=1 Tax=Labrys TaxID=204476 RepID=UPI0028923B48|nr:alpha/beta hydrolase [Labrys neptuniae]MDT3379769.1 alpha/beta hydrolase [Labrys neptuniae]
MMMKLASTTIDTTLDIDGVAIRYRLEGEGTRPLVLVHGVGSYLEAWDGVVERLAPHFRILRFDLRGHGGSARVKGRYEIDDFVRELLALADNAGFGRFALAGFSLGGLIAQRAALDHPGRIESLLLLATVAGRNEDEKERVLNRLRLLQTKEPGSHYDNSVGRWFSEAFQHANPDLMARLRQRNAANDPDCYAAAYRVLAESDFGDEIGAIACPTLIATGEEDQGSNPRMARLMHERIANARLDILSGKRHSILIEAPAEVARLMRSFLS